MSTTKPSTPRPVAELERILRETAKDITFSELKALLAELERARTC